MAMNMPDSPALTEALRLASHGFKVIRLHWPTKQGCSCGRPNCKKSIGKHPIANNWTATGTDDPNTIRKLWQETPYANVGVPMGQINGIFALDVDGPEGIQTLQEWIAEYGELPATWQVQTGGGGIQLWYKIPEGMQIPNSVKKIGVNIDIRGDGGQSVAPGSLHKSGKRYRWAPGRSPEDIPLAEPPEWLIDKIKEVIQARERANLDGIKLDGIDIELNPGRPPNFKKLEQLILSSQKFREIVEGKRTFPSASERDLAMANICAINGWTDQEIADLLLGQRKISGDDLKHPLYYQLTIGKARKWAEEKAKQGEKRQEQPMEIEVEPIPLPEKPKVEPFPVDVFPDPVQQFLTEVSQSMGLPPDYPGIHALTLLGGAIGNTRMIELKPGYRQQPNLYTALVADTGTGKSPALEAAFEPILQIQKEHARTYANLMEEYEMAMRRYHAEMAEWKKRKNDEEPPVEPEHPMMEEIYVTQATLEALLRALKNNNRGLILKVDELSGWIRSMNQYKGGKGDDREHYLSLWSGSDIKVNRVRDGGEPLFIPKPFVAVTGNIPPDILPTLEDEEGNEDGFIHRVLMAYPDAQDPAEWTWVGVSPQTKEDYQNVFNRLYSLKPEIVNSELKPKILRLSNEAKAWWEEWYSIHIREMKDPDFPRRLRGPWAKMPNQLARVALILHMTRVVCGEADDSEVDEISLNRAIQLVKYFKSHIRKAYQQLGKSQMDRRIEEALEWIRRRGGIAKRRDIVSFKVAGCKKNSDADALFEELRDYGYGTVVKESPPKGGRPVIMFKLYGH